ncbi:uncharacterized protein LOC110839758 isoform X2 [Zootermopsis nevadensis]|nr:uncharacterized protein LOC110839758 isoform X2 [Zootermopsis nevadensis]
MDMVFNYLPDVFYQSLRHHNYENSWLNETTNEDRKTRTGHNRTKKIPQDSCKDSRDPCPICQERQRRPLATYIRSKSRQDRKEDQRILEEECEIEETTSSSACDQKSGSPVSPRQTEAAK